MEQRMSLITLGVADLNRSREFYERLGWRRGGRRARWHHVQQCTAYFPVSAAVEDRLKKRPDRVVVQQPPVCGPVRHGQVAIGSHVRVAAVSCLAGRQEGGLESSGK